MRPSKKYCARDSSTRVIIIIIIIIILYYAIHGSRQAYEHKRLTAKNTSKLHLKYRKKRKYKSKSMHPAAHVEPPDTQPQYSEKSNLTLSVSERCVNRRPSCEIWQVSPSSFDTLFSCAAARNGVKVGRRRELVRSCRLADFYITPNSIIK